MKIYRLASSLALAALLLAVPVCIPAEAPAKTLQIGKVQPFQLDNFNSKDSHALYFQVEVHYPKAWMDKVESTFKISVDGKPVPFDWIGGGYSEDAEREFRFYPGTAGKKLLEISLTVDGKPVVASREMTVAATPLVRLMGHVADECVFENAPLSFLVFNAKNPEVKLNGKLVAAEAQPSTDFPGITLLTVPPSLQPGLNQIEITATGAAGQPLTEKSTLLFAANNTVKVGSKLNIVWGYMGSRSGPFFRLGSEGQVLAAAGSSEMDGQSVLNSGDEGKTQHWILAAGVNVYSFTAQAPGKGKLNFEKQSHWMRPFETEKTVEITVVP